jgi:hypothetical protein
MRTKKFGTTRSAYRGRPGYSPVQIEITRHKYGWTAYLVGTNAGKIPLSIPSSVKTRREALSHAKDQLRRAR